MQLIILVHGMWGKARDFDYITDELTSLGFERYEHVIGAEADAETSSIASGLSDGSVRGIVYRTRSNEGYFTYDGIDICGLRVANEVCAVVDALGSEGVKVTELSIVGFSMGGLMARYAVGLLDVRGVLNGIRPKLFITTCSPHVGVNMLGLTRGARTFNAIGAWSMARTSKQAFLRDSDGGQGPLFLRLTQQNTSWTRALAKFDRRVLYANITNDRRCEFYTAAAESKDPYRRRDVRLLRGPFVAEYAPVVLHNSKPDFVGQPEEINTHTPGRSSLLRSAVTWIWQRIRRGTRLGALALRVGIVLPLWFCAFLVNASYQHTASKLRTRQLSLLDPSLLEDSAEDMVEDVYRTVEGDNVYRAGRDTTDDSALELTPLMQQIIDQFNRLGFEKYLLRIAATPMAHAAAIMKNPKRKDSGEGRVAVKHLVDLLAS